MMLVKIKLPKVLLLLSGFILLSGCATTQSGTVLDSNTIAIERHDSRTARIGPVTVYQQKEGGYLVKGKIRRSSYSRGHILGHLDITLLNARGKMVFEASTRYQHKGLRFSSEDFSLKIDKPIKKGSRLKITHHAAASH